MHQLSQIIGTSTVQAFLELRANKLRTFLSLLGITIGIFCIIAVLTVLDSMKNGIQKEMSTLGSDVLYIGRWPWMDEGGQYKWWEYWRRPGMTPAEVKGIIGQVPDAAYACLCLTTQNMTIKSEDHEVSSIQGYAVTTDFDKIKNFEIEQGRYLSPAEVDGGNTSVVLGYEVYDGLFPSHTTAVGKYVTMLGKKFEIAGVMKKMGEDMSGFNFDNSVILPYYTAAAIVDMRSLNNDPMVLVKSGTDKNLENVKYEVEGVLRRLRKVRPGQGNNFAINQLSQISERIELMFGTIDVVGWVIGGISLIVGSFGIANIMFVTVKERTRIIGLKKAIGARKSSILLEFLVEAIVLCLIGGLTGVIIVLIGSLISTYGFDYKIILSFRNFSIGMFVSAVVGVLSGIIPAWSASRLNPVVAIRSN
jgi:putative ABC transport system permease protein